MLGQELGAYLGFDTDGGRSVVAGEEWWAGQWARVLTEYAASAQVPFAGFAEDLGADWARAVVGGTDGEQAEQGRRDWARVWARDLAPDKGAGLGTVAGLAVAQGRALDLGLGLGMDLVAGQGRALDLGEGMGMDGDRERAGQWALGSRGLSAGLGVE